jgi:hypothetical protein
MKLSLSPILAAKYDTMVEVDHCDIPSGGEDQDTDLHMRLDDNQEEARDVQAYLADDCNDHFFHHSDLVDLGEAMGASDGNDEDEGLGSDREEHQGCHYSNDDEHGDGDMGQVVVLLILHALLDD